MIEIRDERRVYFRGEAPLYMSPYPGETILIEGYEYQVEKVVRSFGEQQKLVVTVKEAPKCEP